MIKGTVVTSTSFVCGFYGFGIFWMIWMAQIGVISGQLRTWSLIGVVLFVYFVCICLVHNQMLECSDRFCTPSWLLPRYHCNTWREYAIPYISCTSFCCRLYQKSIRTWLWSWLMKNKKWRRRKKIKVVPIYWKMIGSRLCLRTQTLKWTKMQKNTGQY